MTETDTQNRAVFFAFSEGAGEQVNNSNVVATLNNLDWASSSACTSGAFCGNGAVDEGEECDDGNTVGSDGCSNTCQLN